jgi:hypothetical protein
MEARETPFLFDLVTDILCQVLLRDQQLQLVQGLSPILDIGLQISHFLHVDDTIFYY